MMNKQKEQSQFCLEMMKRLNRDIQKAKDKYDDTYHPSVIQDDIKRLRRELNNLSKMFDWRYKEE